MHNITTATTLPLNLKILQMPPTAALVNFGRGKLRSVGIHVVLVIVTVIYVCLGALIFQTIEQPHELQQRQQMAETLADKKRVLMEKLYTVDDYHVGDELLDEYIEDMFELFSQPYSVHIFAPNTSADRTWTWSTSLLFSATTLIPVEIGPAPLRRGYGLIAPASPFGRLLLVIYGMIGVPLALITIADIAKFTNALLKKFFVKNSGYSAVCFLALTLAYPLIGGVIFWHFTGLSILDGIYFSLISIFTIGYGDTMPDVPVLHLLGFIVLGVMLVTMSIEAVAAQVINNIHYMGRQMGKARAIAGRIFQLAHQMRMKNVFNGIQMQRASISHLFMPSAGQMRSRSDTRRSNAYEPELTDLDFVDKPELPSMVKAASDAKLEAVKQKMSR